MKYLLSMTVLFVFQFGNTQNLSPFFKNSDLFFTNYVNENGKVNYEKIKENPELLNGLVTVIENMDLSNSSIVEKKAFSINAYNIMVINSVIEQYPISSVRKIRGFFKTPIVIARTNTNFDQFEKSLFPKDDPRLHMALVCAANSCPILLNEAYLPMSVDSQLDKACRVSLSKEHMVNVTTAGIELSKIFEWYTNDFDKEGGVISFVNKYTDQSLTNNALSYSPYDWSLNSGDFPVSMKSIPSTYSVNKNVKLEKSLENTIEKQTIKEKKDSRYIVSSLYDRGGWDLNFFNNYYIETVKDINTEAVKSNYIFLTNYLQFVYGINKRFNIGLDLKFRSVTQDLNPENDVFKALSYSNEGKRFSETDAFLGYSRIGLSAIGPKIKILPFLSVPKFSIQSTVFIPLISSESNGTSGYIDWTSPTWNTQFFYDHDITSKMSLFTELDIIIENIDGSIFKTSAGYSQVSTPVSLIMSYFPNNKTTFYLLYNSTPKWNNSTTEIGNELVAISQYDPYSQYGAGFKYFLSDKIQGEFIYTRFHSTNVEKTAHTFNFGIRYFGSK